ncbi:protease Do-like 7 isoform X2 [Rhododendron vialii]|uniref:protease Do-like 7 isoform X2 n=1 Tax=Rhododendron vialii TaxID=182163 RepID=UPI00265F1EF5|nr:protease Do-like 7 isoform X2 [Rhododendron vialii]
MYTLGRHNSRSLSLSSARIHQYPNPCSKFLPSPRISDPSVHGMAGEEEPCVEMGPEEFKESNGVTAEDWRNALSKVVPAVVVIHTTSCRAFDTHSAGSSHATGFVVDKKRGIILTNRHVVKPGPVVAEAMFLNREEIPVYPMYRDPVHDFGFFRYDPGLIQFLSYEEIPLAPEAACVGLEIRVVGNDSGEKVSILAGTLARLDRDAPRYDKDGYNDFNTFYIQAASGTKGGSSGSPVIDSQGRAVALNAGSKPSRSSAFYLPLERVVRALKLLQKGRDSCTDGLGAVYIPRGTLQVTLLHKGFDETRRLGLRIETEQIVRDASRPGETGMLLVDSAVPGGPAHHLLQPGDVLVRVNGKVITQFLEMETLLDDSVDHKIELQIERGGTPFTVDLSVQDLHSITPDSFLEVSGAVIHPLSYQQARNFRFHCGLVYVAEPGYLLGAKVPRHSIIKRFGGEEISRLEDLISVLSKLTRGAQVPLEFISYKDRHRTKSVLVTMDRHEWYGPPLVYTRNDSTGLWTRKPALPPESPLLSSGMISVEQGLENCRAPPGAGEASLIERMCQNFNRVSVDGVTSVESSFKCVAELQNFRDDSDVGATKNQIEEDSSGDSIVVANFSFDEPRVEKPEDSTSSENVFSGDYQGSAAVATNVSVAERVIEPTLVMVEVHVPPSCMLDGVHSLHSLGTGVIVYHSPDKGLVVVDKTTVVISASDVMLSFAAFPIEIPGEVVFLHPVHNYALVAYDPSALGADGGSVVRAAKLLPEPPLCRGDAVYLVGLSRSLQATSRKSIVTNAHAAINIGPSDSPRYRATNIEVIELDADFGSTFSGVLSDEHGRVQAIWGSFSGQKYGSSPLENYRFVRGIPIHTISQILDEIISGANGPNLLINGVRRQMPPIRILEVELYPRLLSKARSFGLSNNWVQTLVKKDPIRRQVICVKGCLAGSKAENVLQPGDMILAINKEPITCFGDIEDGCRVLNQCDESDGKLGMTIFRRGCEIEMLVGTDVRDGNGTKRVISWCGCIVQDPHPAVRALGFLPDEGHGVYVARLSSGSPAHRYGLYDRQWIVEVNGKRTPDLDAFVEVTKEIDDGEFARVKTVKLTGKPQVLTLKQDLHYWPTWEVRRNPYTALWQHKTIKALDRGTS